MSARTRTIVLWLLAAVALALLAAWWHHTYRLVERTVPLSPAGEAGYNPLYALKRALQADGIPVDSRQRLDFAAHAPGPRDTVLLFGDPRTLSAREVDQLLAWVEGGGHLLATTPGDARRTGARDDGLLPRLGLSPMPRRRCEDFVVPGEPHHVEFCRGHRFGLRGVDPLLSWGDFDAGFVFARQQRGEGLVDVLAELDFLRNDKLDDAPHVALARQLLDPNYGQGTIHLVYAASMPPLWRLLLERAWMAWLPLLLALVAWLWWRLQRIGPAMPAPAETRRSLLEHVQASGEHLRRYGQSSLLHAALREDVLARLRRRDPLAAALDGVARAEAIAARTGLAAPDIEHALRSPRPRDSRDFRLRVARLIEMRKRL
ncbi:MAG TPA: DUF4350 domain-containing protein [Luteimonas sp.]|nr:DUF4350 domain-containing protein [Luteimonas sp.]